MVFEFEGRGCFTLNQIIGRGYLTALNDVRKSQGSKRISSRSASFHSPVLPASVSLTWLPVRAGSAITPRLRQTLRSSVPHTTAEPVGTPRPSQCSEIRADRWTLVPLRGDRLHVAASRAAASCFVLFRCRARVLPRLGLLPRRRMPPLLAVGRPSRRQLYLPPVTSMIGRRGPPGAPAGGGFRPACTTRCRSR